MSYNRVLLFLTVGLLVVISLAWAAVTVAYKHITMPRPLPHTPQVWAHRGYHAEAPQNTMRAYRAAFEAGAPGIELDVNYDDSLNRFVVSYHTDPYKKPNGKLLFLYEIWDTLGQHGYFWVDLKNLTTSNASASLQRMKNMLEKYGIQDKVFVESPHGWALRKYARADIQTLLWIKHKQGSLTSLQQRLLIVSTPFTGISFPFEYLDRPNFRQQYGHLPWYVFTANKEKDLALCRKWGNAQVILSDKAYWKDDRL